MKFYAIYGLYAQKKWGLFKTFATCRVNAGDVTVLVATRNIAKGEEISDIYSMHYSENGTKQGRPDVAFLDFQFLHRGLAGLQGSF